MGPPTTAEDAGRVAVVGAGVAGLTCAYRLGQAGVPCDVYERWPGLGGQAATMDLGDGTLIERYYHYLFTSDQIIIDLFEELGLGDTLKRLDLSTAVLIDGRIWPFNGALDLLRFRPIPLLTRLRMGFALLRMQRGRQEDFESMTAREWIIEHMGKGAWDGLWEPMMRGKFGERASEISMVWIWDKMMKRRNVERGEATGEAFIYPDRTFEPLFQGLAERIEGAGGRVMIDRPAMQIDLGEGGLTVQPAKPDSFRRGLDPREFEPDGPPIPYEAVVCALPGETFVKLLSPALSEQVGSDYLDRAEGIEHLAAFNLLLELERPLTEHFWVNVADRRCPFVGVIDHTNLVGTERYGGRVFSHISNYLAHDNELLTLDMEELIDRYESGLRIVNPEFERSWIKRSWLFREPEAQPVVSVGYPERIPSRQTPVDGLMMVNTSQIYPEDRGTNYAARDGERVASEAADYLTAGTRR